MAATPHSSKTNDPHNALASPCLICKNPDPHLIPLRGLRIHSTSPSIAECFVSHPGKAAPVEFVCRLAKRQRGYPICRQPFPLQM
jgi:hypothetical protein